MQAATQPLLRKPDGNQRGALIELAAAFVDDAFAGFVDDDFKRPALQRLSHNLSIVRNINMTVYMGLALVERPAWCWTSDCGDPSVSVRRALRSLTA